MLVTKSKLFFDAEADYRLTKISNKIYYYKTGSLDFPTNQNPGKLRRRSKKVQGYIKSKHKIHKRGYEQAI